MSDKEGPDSLDNSLNGEFPLQEKDDGELNMSVGSSVSDSETEKKVRTESPSSPRIPPAFMVAGIWQYDFIWLYRWNCKMVLYIMYKHVMVQQRFFFNFLYIHFFYW